MEKNKPCRYYEEQGFCVYGETCQYSHGTNPVVLDGVNAGLILTSTVSTTALTGSTNTISTAANHQSTSRNSSVSSNDETNHQGSNSASNNNNNLHKRLGGAKKRGDRNPGPGRNSGSGVGGGGGVEGHHNRHHHHHNNNNNASNNNNNNHHHHHQQHPNNHNNNHGSGRHSGPSNTNNSHRHSNNNNGAGNSGQNYSHHNNNNSKTIDKCTLEVRRVPQHQNTIKDMNEHFSKFGTIVNLQVNYEGDPEGALIQYSSPHEAIAAYRSPEAVFNNRFIRVHWHFKPSMDLANHQASDHSAGNQQDNSKRFRRNSGTNDDDEEQEVEKDEDIKEGGTNNRGDKLIKAKEHHNQISKQYKGQQTALNRIGKKRSIMMRLGSKAPSSKFSNNQAGDQDEEASASDEPPAKIAPLDPDRAENNQASPASAHLRTSIKSRRELGLQNIKQQQDFIDANSNKKKVQKQGVEIQRKQSDLLTNLIHQQKILIKKIESSTEEKERASLKSILDELTQKTKDLMTKTSLKQNMIISKQQAATKSTTKTSSDDPPSTSAAISSTDHNADATTVAYKEGVENDDEEKEQEEDQNTLEPDMKDQKVDRLDQRELTVSEVDGASN